MKSLQLNIFLADFSHLEPLHRAVRDELTVTGDAQPNYGSFRVWFGCRSVLACYKATVACVLRLSCFADRKAKIAKKKKKDTYSKKKKEDHFFYPTFIYFRVCLVLFPLVTSTTAIMVAIQVRPKNYPKYHFNSVFSIFQNTFFRDGVRLENSLSLFLVEIM